MKYIILAAGVGSRLYPYTKNSPKCLVKVTKDETVVERAVRLIKKYDPRAEIYIAIGFKGDSIKNKMGDKCQYVNNPFYAVTNSIASLWFINNHFHEESDITILNGDIVFSEEFAKEITKSPEHSMVYYDSSIKSHGDYNVQTLEDSMIVMGKELTTYDGEYVGISKIPARECMRFFNEIETMVNDGLFDQWYENALVQMSLNDTMEIKAVDVAYYEWSEIDSIDNLLKIRKIISKEEN